MEYSRRCVLVPKGSTHLWRSRGNDVMPRPKGWHHIVPPDLYRSARKIFTEGNEIFRRDGINPSDPVRTGQVVRSSSLKAVGIGLDGDL